MRNEGCHVFRVQASSIQCAHYKLRCAAILTKTVAAATSMVAALNCHGLADVASVHLVGTNLGIGIFPIQRYAVYMTDEIGSRVRDVIQSLNPPLPQKEIARQIGMTSDAFSRSLNGQRSFSSIELAEVSDLLDADIHWLITGQPSASRVSVAARHRYEQGKWSNPGQDGDQLHIDSISLAYRQAFEGQELGPSSLPNTPAAARDALGGGFVRDFINRLETKLRIDVVRIPDLSTSYCLTFGPHNVIALQATPHWFHENWSLAHELGHLALGHMDSAPGDGSYRRNEAAANAFAAELLMPTSIIRRCNWIDMTSAELADHVWEWGISTQALCTRLRFLNVPANDTVLNWGNQSTQRLLRSHSRVVAAEGPDQITTRMDAASVRQFPTGLLDAHYKGVDSGRLGPHTLAWMLDVEVGTITSDIPSLEVDIDDLADALGL